jgi:hypothetical protein
VAQEGYLETWRFEDYLLLTDPRLVEGLAASGVVNLGRVGDTESPYLRAAKTAFAMVRAGIQSFGLSPSDRCRLVAPGEADAEDPMESLLSATTPRITDLRALVEGKRGRDGDGK